MRVRLHKVWDDLRSNYWVLPLSLAVLAAAFALLIGVLDRAGWPPILQEDNILVWTGPSSARAILSTIAAAAITVAGVIFSITLVVLSLAASQLGPRLLRTFLQRGGTQIVLGVFIATFVFCLLALRLVPETGDEQDVPRLAVLIGMGLGFLSFLVLILYIHHMVHFIQAPEVLAAVSEELQHALERVFPACDDEEGDMEKAEGEDDPDTWPGHEDEATDDLRATQGGYVQAIAYQQLVHAAALADVRVRCQVRPGNFVAAGDLVLRIHPAHRMDDDLREKLREAYVMGRGRTVAQDPEQGLNQLVEVAVRALSPGVNDPFTALTAVERIGGALAFIARRRLPATVRRDEEGRARVWTIEHDHDGLVGAAFDQIRQHARSDVAVTMRLLDVIARIARHQPVPAFARALARQADRIREGVAEDVIVEDDREAIERAHRGAREALADLI